MRWTPALVLLFIILVIASFARDASASRIPAGATDTSTSLAESTSLSPSGTPTPLRSMQPDSPLRPPVDEWTTYTSESGGYTLEVPVGWTVEERSSLNGSIAIVPPVFASSDTIRIRYLEFERPPEDDLPDWYRYYFEHDPGMMTAMYRYDLVSFDKEQYPQAVFRHIESEPVTQFYAIPNGRLVLEFFSIGATEQQAAVLRRVAESVTFGEDAPTSVLDISDPENPPIYITIEDHARRLEILETVRSAYTVFERTGDIPQYVQEDPLAAAEFKQYADHQRERKEAERLATQEAALITPEPTAIQLPTITPTPRPTPNETQVAWSQLTYEEQEHIYNSRMAPTWTYEAVIAAQPTSPIPATPTFTPIPDEILVDTMKQYEGFHPLLKKVRYHPELDAILVWYDPEIWEYVIDENGAQSLVLLDDPECILFANRYMLNGIAISEEYLTNRKWRVVWQYYDNYVYHTDVDGANIQANLWLPEDQQYRDLNKGECQRLAEDVLDTASVVDAALLE